MRCCVWKKKNTTRGVNIENLVIGGNNAVAKCRPNILWKYVMWTCWLRAEPTEKNARTYIKHVRIKKKQHSPDQIVWFVNVQQRVLFYEQFIWSRDAKPN